MTFSQKLIVLSSVVLMAVWSTAARQEPQLLTFRSDSEAVSVYVSVRSGGAVVNGLGANDFALSDNGVPQQVNGVFTEDAPIDVTLLVDTSQSVFGSLDAFKTDIGRISQLLKPDEQMRLVAFETSVREILPMQGVSKRPPVSGITVGENTSLNDALLFSLARALRAFRRHMVFVFTDGYDTSSMLDGAALPEIAGRSDALLHVVLVRPNVPPDPRASRALALLAEAARRTGGAVYPPTNQKDDIVASFQRAIEAFRLSYVLYFTPPKPEVPRPGWHTLTVTVKKPGGGSYDVRAREGYFGR
jgi:hypothetical protein